MTVAAITLIGGPTALVELNGLRFLTDPTFDDPGDYQLPHVTLRKTAPPTLFASEIGAIDAVLHSHDQHADNLDLSGRAFLPKASRVLTTSAGAARLGGNAEGLLPWETRELTGTDGSALLVTATPARHGPAGIEPLSGDVIGFVLSSKSHAFKPVYVTGDTVWFDGVAEVQRRFEPGLVLLFAGAAQTRGKFNLTMNANDAIEAALAFSSASIVPLHTDGWAHFTESGDDLEQAFNALGHGERLRRLRPGVPAAFSLQP